VRLCVSTRVARQYNTSQPVVRTTPGALVGVLAHQPPTDRCHHTTYRITRGTCNHDLVWPVTPGQLSGLAPCGARSLTTMSVRFSKWPPPPSNHLPPSPCAITSSTAKEVSRGGSVRCEVRHQRSRRTCAQHALPVGRPCAARRHAPYHELNRNGAMGGAVQAPGLWGAPRSTLGSSSSRSSSISRQCSRCTSTHSRSRCCPRRSRRRRQPACPPLRARQGARPGSPSSWGCRSSSAGASWPT
jgi:hypothetical protein